MWKALLCYEGQGLLWKKAGRKKGAEEMCQKKTWEAYLHMKRFVREVTYHCPNKDKNTEKHHRFGEIIIIYPAWSHRFGGYFVDFLGFCSVCRTGSISKCLNLRRKLSQNTKKQTTTSVFGLGNGEIENLFLRRRKDRAPIRPCPWADGISPLKWNSFSPWKADGARCFVIMVSECLSSSSAQIMRRGPGYSLLKMIDLPL